MKHQDFFPQESTEIFSSIPEPLKDIAEKVFTRKRLSVEEGIELLVTPHDNAVNQLANWARMDRVGDIVYFASTLYIHPTNLCELSCPLCSFYAKPGWEKAWFMQPKEIEEQVRANLKHDLTEIHIVGGLWRDCNLTYYKEIFEKIKRLNPSLHIKALTPVEYDFLAKIHNIPIKNVLSQMMDWGLGSLPGGGAEILVEEIRSKIAPGKITSQEYLNVHRIAHQIGLPSNISMLFGHIEEPEHIILHLNEVRSLQDETQGFQTFVPLKYHSENNALGKRKERLKPKNIRKIYAVSRLFLDNIRNLKVLWNYVGVEEAQEILKWGANDFAATQIEEKIITMAGGVQLKMTSSNIAKLIQDIGRTPKKIHSGHNYSLDHLNLIKPREMASSPC